MYQGIEKKKLLSLLDNSSEDEVIGTKIFNMINCLKYKKAVDISEHPLNLLRSTSDVETRFL